MLNQETKQKIDSTRDILVGKVPDPKSQVEQITTALIYKFMDDMDKEAEELGGRANFFSGEFARYAWTKLFDPKLSGQQKLDLYVQAISNMPKNPHIPQLFRDIFKGAFLPYNDPRALSLFLKEINEFNYEHSEDLGDAFEYLLSVLGSQGDAGQFRTPRHIIDFIVEAVDPKKNETILDPACGTAGFLISAYKHILKTNQEKLLTPDEKLKLMNNLAGYDISPDMVKLALVNMYLHGSPNPKIYEYDTLSSEKRWDETFDVVLANPPFMTSRGGIIPHKRFSVQSNHAEVLFVDYIVEHLNINGRTGIIVPEGIIFQSNKMYVNLRKKLVEDGLFAVVSLPSGVFQPYSVVKTSILLFDNVIAKKTKNILFIKINNDGFDLGAQRRKIDKNDLPTARAIIQKYKLLLDGKKFSAAEKEIAHIVAKEKIAESGDYNLTGERYKEVETFKNQKWPMVELGEVCEIESGARQRGGALNKGIPSIGGEQINSDSSLRLNKMKYISEEFFKTMKRGILQKGDVLIVKDGATTGKVGYFEKQFKRGAVNEHVFILRSKKQILPYFLFKVVQNKKFQNILQKYKKGIIGGISLEIKKIKIPIPPLSVQKEIVKQIEIKQQAIDHAKAIIKNLEREREYFGASLRKIEGIEWVELGGMEKEGKIQFLRGQGISKKDIIENGKNKCIHYGEIYTIYQPIIKKIVSGTNVKGKILSQKGDILVPSTTTADAMGIAVARSLNIDNVIIGGDINIIRTKNEYILADYLAYLISNSEVKKQLATFAKGVNILHLSNSDLRKLKIPLPSLKIQKRLVAEAEEEQEIIDANKRLIEIMEEKIEKVLKEI